MGPRIKAVEFGAGGGGGGRGEAWMETGQLKPRCRQNPGKVQEMQCGVLTSSEASTKLLPSWELGDSCLSWQTEIVPLMKIKSDS